MPASHIGFSVLSLEQLKITREVSSLTVFIPFAVYYMNQPFTWDYVWAALRMVGPVYFMFRP
ncbi:DMT family protein [Craterilacuibacter sinensis]|uniref:DMT family protein n=1 Tax=Craterilacuibacter sinensis TaxID=2686017 RepID=UPI002E2A6F2B|nr:DMT family protein [Craterilacuibacter sinensis]